MPYKDKEKNRERNKIYREKNKEKISIKRKKYYQENKERILQQEKEYRKEHPEKRREYMKKYVEEHKEQRKEYAKKYREENKDKISEKNRKYNLKNKEKIRKAKKGYEQRESSKMMRRKRDNERYRKKKNEYQNNKKKKDPNFAVQMRIRRLGLQAFGKFANGKIMKSRKYGIDYQAIIEHLKPFPEDLSKYHIDHIRPLCSFKFINEDGTQNLEEIKKAFAPENHQWLLAEKNLKKIDFFRKANI